ncbi:GDSL esterase/lipase At1g54790-like [Impatiens glandulifera]|uniref:GDSL esterase/lipase At1g54790-like n=1 Tax=Impatiens glandulifera TaxID=253017 RepID=UPI001FB14DD6|nr:GDSL esterase/lipase At1g54790-like [Impatiens glandulifera]
MASKSLNLVFAIATLVISTSVFPLCTSLSLKYPAIFNFGDSNSDTGNMLAGKGGSLHAPYGKDFRSPSGRFSDGRLVVDFLAKEMGLPYLNPYLESTGAPNFKRGCNFAAAGATILPAKGDSFCPFSFDIQVLQFIRFKARVAQLRARSSHKGGKKRMAVNILSLLPKEEYFEKGIYMFDIGQNDVGGVFWSNKTQDQIFVWISTVIDAFKQGLEELYSNGARNFWIHNTGPVGCLPETLTYFGPTTNRSNVDAFGCLKDHNEADKAFNLQLAKLCNDLQKKWPKANITYVDIYNIKYDLIANHTRHGFEESIMGCCGYGGPPTNFNSSIPCGSKVVLKGEKFKSKVCQNSTKYVSWDGTHYGQSANRFVASQILNGNYIYPALSNKMSNLIFP